MLESGKMYVEIIGVIVLFVALPTTLLGEIFQLSVKTVMSDVDVKIELFNVSVVLPAGRVANILSPISDTKPPLTVPSPTEL